MLNWKNNNTKNLDINLHKNHQHDSFKIQRTNSEIYSPPSNASLTERIVLWNVSRHWMHYTIEHINAFESFRHGTLLLMKCFVQLNPLQLLKVPHHWMFAIMACSHHRTHQTMACLTPLHATGQWRCGTSKFVTPLKPPHHWKISGSHNNIHKHNKWYTSYCNRETDVRLHTGTRKLLAPNTHGSSPCRKHEKIPNTLLTRQIQLPTLLLHFQLPCLGRKNVLNNCMSGLMSRPWKTTYLPTHCSW